MARGSGSAERNAITDNAAVTVEVAFVGEVRNTCTYNAAISACEEGGRRWYALFPLAEMVHGRLRRDTITSTAVVSTRATSRHCIWAVELLEAMAGGRLETNTIKCRSGVGACKTSWRMVLGRTAPGGDVEW